jgi:hypothetical protein
MYTLACSSRRLFLSWVAHLGAHSSVPRHAATPQTRVSLNLFRAAQTVSSQHHSHIVTVGLTTLYPAPTMPHYALYHTRGTPSDPKHDIISQLCLYWAQPPCPGYVPPSPMSCLVRLLQHACPSQGYAPCRHSGTRRDTGQNIHTRERGFQWEK